MTTLESSVAPQTNSRSLRGPEPRDTVGEDRSQTARAFLIHLVTHEIQLCPHVARWLRSTAQQLEAQDRHELAGACLRLSAETWELREQLIALAHRLVARRNRLCGHRRINAMLLLELPLTPGMRAFLEINELAVSQSEASIELEILASVEELMVGSIPLAIELAGLDDNGDLYEAAACYQGRSARAAALRGLVEAVARIEPADAKEQSRTITRALDCFNRIALESVELGRRLDGELNSMC